MLQVPNISRTEYTLLDVNEEGFVSVSCVSLMADCWLVCNFSVTFVVALTSQRPSPGCPCFHLRWQQLVSALLSSLVHAQWAA